MFLYLMSNKDRFKNGTVNSYTTHSSQGIIESYWMWSNMYHCVYGLFMPLAAWSIVEWFLLLVLLAT